MTIPAKVNITGETMDTLLILGIFIALAISIRLGVVGIVLNPDNNTPPTGRQAKTGDAVVTQGHGKYYEMSSRGLCWSACDQGAGVTVQVTITTTATLTLHNPAASTKRIEILKVAVAYFSGTMPAGSFYHGKANTTTLPSGGTALSAQLLDIGNQSGATSVGVCLAGSTVVSGVALWSFASSFPQLATTANGFQTCIEDVDGLIILEPGQQYQLLGVFGAAGTSPKVSPGIVWMEVPFAGTNG